MDYAVINEDLKKYFADLLIAEYRCSDQNRAFIKLLYDVAFVDALALQIKNECLNVEESIGKQLDQVGEWVGVDRLYNNNIIWNRAYFSFVDWNKTPNPIFQGGFSNYKNFEYLDGFTMTWKALQDLKPQVYKLGDNYFRELIKLKIIKNSIRFTKKEIDEAIYKWSNGQVHTVWEKMKLTYKYNLQYSQIMGLALLKNCLPVPVGCELHIDLI